MISLGSWWSSFRTEKDDIPSAQPKLFWQRLFRQERLTWIGAGTLAVCLVGLGALVFMALGDRHVRTLPASEVPLITADDKPFKIRPEDPGGLDVPDRDKLVYEQMRGGENVVVVERLLTEPELPLQPPLPPQVFPEGNGGNAPVSGGVPGIDPDATIEPSPEAGRVEEAPDPAAPAHDRRETVNAMNSGGLVIPAPKARPQTPQAPAVLTAQTPAVMQAGRYHVQLLAVRSSSAAMDEWNRLNARNGDVLAGLSPHVSRLERGGQNPLFRLRAGPLKNEKAARALCQSLIERSVGCIVVAPGA